MILEAGGPKTSRVYSVLRARILSGAAPRGSKLPPHTRLATEFQVAPMTVRQVLARLESEGLVSREAGRGTFVRAPARPAVLIVDSDVAACLVVAEHVTRAGLRAIEAADPADALAALASNPEIALVLSNVHLPAAEDGIAFVRTVRRQHPDLPLAAVTAHADDLRDLLGTSDCPVLIVAKPVRTRHVREVLRLALRVPLPD